MEDNRYINSAAAAVVLKTFFRFIVEEDLWGAHVNKKDEKIIGELFMKAQ